MQKPQPERPHLMDLEGDIPETPEARQTTLPLPTTRVSV